MAWAVLLQTATDACSSMHITMYGNTKATPAVYGCHGNFFFISGHIFIRETEYDEVKVHVTNFV